MSLKAKIIAQFKTKYPTVALSNERLDAIADRLDSKITEETEIDAKLDELNEIFPFADIAKDDDRLRNAEAKAKKKPETKAKTKTPIKKEEEEEEEETPPADDTPAWAKALLAKVENLEKAKVTTSRKETLLSKIKDADEKYKSKVLRDFERMKIENEEEFTTVLTDVENDFKEYSELVHNAKFGKDKPFGGVGGSNGKVKEASDADVDEVFNQIKK